jgi:hypothetical protein
VEACETFRPGNMFLCDLFSYSVLKFTICMCCFYAKTLRRFCYLAS